MIFFGGVYGNQIGSVHLKVYLATTLETLRHFEEVTFSLRQINGAINVTVIVKSRAANTLKRQLSG